MLASSLKSILASLGEPVFGWSEELFFSRLQDLGGGEDPGGLLGAFLITSGKGGDRGR